MGLDNTIHSSLPILPEFAPSRYDIGTWHKETAGWAYAFRGALVADVVVRLSGVSLFADVIDNHMLRAIAQSMSKHVAKTVPRAGKLRYRATEYDVYLGTVRCLSLAFSLTAAYDGWIESSF